MRSRHKVEVDVSSGAGHGVWPLASARAVGLRWRRTRRPAPMIHWTPAGRVDHLPHRGRTARGRKAVTLQDLPAVPAPPTAAVAATGGFSLHAGVAARAGQRAKLERLCRYISRPAVSEQRLWLTPDGWVGYDLKTPWRDGTTQVFFEPLDFLARLAALVPNPRINLTRFHGVFAPSSKLRARVTPSGRGKGSRPIAAAATDPPTPAERHAAMTPDQVRGRLWAQRLKRVFDIDIQTCAACGGDVRIVAAIRGGAPGTCLWLALTSSTGRTRP